MNFSFKSKTDSGFSLIELLVGVAIMITTTTIVLSIIISSFRISSKTTASSIVRQNGNYTLSQVSRMLQFADSFEGAFVNAGDSTATACALGLTVNRIDIKYNKNDISFVCTNSDITIDGKSSINTNNIQVSSCSFICTQPGSEGPVIKINFDLTTGDLNTPIENRASVNFSTTVKMRNP